VRAKIDEFYDWSGGFEISVTTNSTRNTTKKAEGSRRRPPMDLHDGRGLALIAPWDTLVDPFPRNLRNCF